MLALLEPRDCPLDLRVDPGRGVDHEQDQVRVLGSAPRGLHHSPVEAAAGLEDAGGVDQQDLRRPFDGNPHQPRAGGLRLGGDDRDFLADQRVHKRRLAGVGRADHRDEASERLPLPLAGGGRGVGGGRYAHP